MKKDKSTTQFYFVISKKIVESRHKAGLTQKQLADKIHSTKSAISKYENGSYQGYGVDLLWRIAQACGADLEIKFIFKKNKKLPTYA